VSKLASRFILAATPMKVANTIVARAACCTLRRTKGPGGRGGGGGDEGDGRVRFKIQQVVRLTVTMLPNVLPLAIVPARRRDRSSTPRGGLRHQRRETCESRNGFGSAPGYPRIRLMPPTISLNVPHVILTCAFVWAVRTTLFKFKSPPSRISCSRRSTEYSRLFQAALPSRPPLREREREREREAEISRYFFLFSAPIYNLSLIQANFDSVDGTMAIARRTKDGMHCI